MGGREIVEGKHHVAILAQTLAGLGIFVLVATQEAVVGRLMHPTLLGAGARQRFLDP